MGRVERESQVLTAEDYRRRLPRFDYDTIGRLTEQLNLEEERRLQNLRKIRNTVVWKYLKLLYKDLKEINHKTPTPLALSFAYIDQTLGAYAQSRWEQSLREGRKQDFARFYDFALGVDTVIALLEAAIFSTPKQVEEAMLKETASKNALGKTELSPKDPSGLTTIKLIAGNYFRKIDKTDHSLSNGVVKEFAAAGAKSVLQLHRLVYPISQDVCEQLSNRSVRRTI